MLKKIAVSAAVALACSSAAQAASYYVVVPVPNRAVAAPVLPQEQISVSLNGQTLPAGQVGVAYPGVDLRALLQVSGDPQFAGAGVLWQVSQGSLPAGLILDPSSGWLSGTPSNATGAAGQAFQVTASYKSKSGSRGYSLVVAAGEVRSCNDHLASNPGAPSGWYQLDPDGAGPRAKASYYCDMTSDGGGWTRVVRQFEASPVTDWNGGGNGASYSMATAAIPPHTQVGFGKDESATDFDYVNGTYSSGSISKVLVTSPKTGITYHMDRSPTGVYNGNDPDNGFVTNAPTWYDSLTLNQAYGYEHGWAFSPGTTNPNNRGYAYKGGRYDTAEAYAWTVWVR